MKTRFIIFVCTFITSMLCAQINHTDVIYLKNGNVHRGIIIEEVPNISYKIKTNDNNIFECKIEEIEKLTREFHTREAGYIPGHLQPGYRRIIEIGHEFRENNWSTDRLKLNLINAYQLNPFISLGIGTGIRYYYEYNDVSVPLFADFRTHFMNTKTSPYLGLGFGYMFDINTRIRGAGLLFSPTAGVSFKAFHKAQMNVGIGYEIQRFRTWYRRNTVSVNLGISF